MALLDFLKKTELDEINRLKTELAQAIQLKEFLKTEYEQRIVEFNNKLNQYSAVISIQEQVEKEQKDLENIKSQKEFLSQELRKAVDLANTTTTAANVELAKMQADIEFYTEKIFLLDCGVYQPLYNYERSEDYRAEQNRIIDLQKKCILEDKAVVCIMNWTVDGSRAKGLAKTKKHFKLVLRAFNGECDILISKVKWNNIIQIKERIIKSFDAINKLSEDETVSIQKEYLDLKISELVLEHEFNLKKQIEKEAIRAEQEEVREEEKAKREYERAQKKAEQDEDKFLEALEKAKRELQENAGSENVKLKAQIEKLEKDLSEAQERKERAMSMAQQTKRGYVYVISNIGSFGEGIYKIGMTRRLEPLDRVRELGDASVPFQFDVHAMMYCENAPALEAMLHKAFDTRKVNMLNYRKEFFRVSLEDIEAKIKEFGLDAELVKRSEATEYRETLSILTKI